MQLQTLLKIIYAAIMPCRQGPVNDVAYHGTCEDQLRNSKTAEVCFSVSHAGCHSPSSAKFDPESITAMSPLPSNVFPVSYIEPCFLLSRLLLFFFLCFFF